MPPILRGCGVKGSQGWAHVRECLTLVSPARIAHYRNIDKASDVLEVGNDISAGLQFDSSAGLLEYRTVCENSHPYFKISSE